MAASALGADAVRGRWRILLARTERRDWIMAALSDVAIGSPETANAWLAEALLTGRLPSANVAGRLQRLTAHWIRWLPEGMPVDGGLELGMGLVKLPRGLRVPGDLWLQSCESLRSLPANLDVGGWLMMNYLPSWDGAIPADATVGWRLVTDRHPDGISLADWRRAHPSGSERT